MAATLRRPSSTAWCPARPAGGSSGFTLVELLVTMVVLLVLSLMMVTMTNQTSRLWKSSRARIDAFQSARNAYERITDHLSQATLGTYLDYYNAAGKSRTDLFRAASAANPNATPPPFIASTYGRSSDLQFVCGQAAGLVPPAGGGSRPMHAVFFQAPLGYVSSGTGTSDFKGLSTVLNAVGYYIDFSNDNAVVPAFMTSATPAGSPASSAGTLRYRLMELYQPAQNLKIYCPVTVPTASPYSGTASWFYLAVNPASAAGTTVTAPTILTADNIVALIVRPEAASTATAGNSTTTSTAEIAPYYAYDTKSYLAQANADGTSEAATYYAQAKNQLPPLVQVTMVALDADSGSRLAAMFGTSAPPLYASSPFVDVTKYAGDLSALQTVLHSYHLNYHVFVSDVSLPAAQWSQ